MKQILSYSILIYSLMGFLQNRLEAQVCENLFKSAPTDSITSTLQDIQQISGAISKTYTHISSGKVITIIFDRNKMIEEEKPLGERLRIHLAHDLNETPWEYRKEALKGLQYANLRAKLKELAEQTVLVALDPYELSYFAGSKEVLQYQIIDMLVRLQKGSEIPKINEGEVNSLLLNQRNSINEKTKSPRYLNVMEATLFPLMFAVTLLPVDAYSMISIMFSYIGLNVHTLIKYSVNRDRVILEHQLGTSTKLIDSLLETSDRVVLILPDFLQKKLTEAFSRNSDFEENGI